MVYVIVLNWKGAADTIACVKSVLLSEGQRFKIIICDNASPDNSYDVILRGLKDSLSNTSIIITEISKTESECGDINTNNDSEIILIQTGSNLGFAGGNNVGIRYAMRQPDCEFIWILNNDTEVTSTAMMRLVNKFEDPSVGICGSKLVYYHDRSTIQALGGLYNPLLGHSKHYGDSLPSDSVFDDEKVSALIDYPVGASIMLRKNMLSDIGVFSEVYFLYFEELDLVKRAFDRWKVKIATDSVVYHKEGASTGGKTSDFACFYSIRSRLIFSKKFYPSYYFLVRILLLLTLFNRVRKLDFSQAKIILRLLVLGESIDYV